MITSSVNGLSFLVLGLVPGTNPASSPNSRIVFFIVSDLVRETCAGFLITNLRGRNREFSDKCREMKRVTTEF